MGAGVAVRVSHPSAAPVRVGLFRTSGEEESFPVGPSFNVTVAANASALVVLVTYPSGFLDSGNDSASALEVCTLALAVKSVVGAGSNVSSAERVSVGDVLRGTVDYTVPVAGTAEAVNQSACAVFLGGEAGWSPGPCRTALSESAPDGRRATVRCSCSVAEALASGSPESGSGRRLLELGALALFSVRPGEDVVTTPKMNVIGGKDLTALTPANLARYPVPALVLATVLVTFLTLSRLARHRDATLSKGLPHRSSDHVVLSAFYGPRTCRARLRYYWADLKEHHLWLSVWTHSHATHFTSMERLHNWATIQFLNLMWSALFYVKDASLRSLTAGVLADALSYLPTVLQRHMFKSRASAPRLPVSRQTANRWGYLSLRKKIAYVSGWVTMVVATFVVLVMGLRFDRQNDTSAHFLLACLFSVLTEVFVSQPLARLLLLWLRRSVRTRPPAVVPTEEGVRPTAWTHTGHATGSHAHQNTMHAVLPMDTSPTVPVSLLVFTPGQTPQETPVATPASSRPQSPKPLLGRVSSLPGKLETTSPLFKPRKGRRGRLPSLPTLPPPPPPRGNNRR